MTESKDYSVFYKTENGYEAKINIGKVKEEDLRLSIEDGILSIFTRETSFRCWLPKNIKEDSLFSKYEDETLEILLKAL